MVSLTFHPSGFSGKMLTTEQDDDQEHRRDRGRATDNLNPDHRDATPIPGMETRRSKKYLRYLFSLLMLIIQVTSEMLLTSLMAKKIHPDLLNTVSRPRKTFFLCLPSWLIKSIGIKFNWIACLQTALKVVIFTQSEEMARFRQYLATYSQIKISPIWSNRFKYLRVTVYNLIVLWSMKQG